jgi:hypothetical protein
MNTSLKLIAAAAAVLVVAVAGCQPVSNSGGAGGEPTVGPSPSASVLARGTFKLFGAEVELDATGDGDRVTGTMSVTHEDGDFTVDLKCTRTTEDGVILIAGDIGLDVSVCSEGRRRSSRFQAWVAGVLHLRLRGEGRRRR